MGSPLLSNSLGRGNMTFALKISYWFSGKSCTDLEEFRNYLEKRFDFEQVTVKKFRTWAERRQFNREMKRKQAESERPILPANQKLITLSVQDAPTKKGRLEIVNCNIGRLVILLFCI